MNNKDPKKFWVRIACFVLAGLMVLGVATTAIFLIVDLVSSQNDKKKSLSIEEQVNLPNYEERWTI